MKTLLFFDDQRLLKRENMRRVLGTPKLIPESIYRDPHTSIGVGFPSVWQDEKSGLWRMAYQGFVPDKGYEVIPQMAISRDGVHFEPEDVTGDMPMPNRMFKNEYLPHELVHEVAKVYQDPYAPAEERYKALCIDYHHDEHFVVNTLWTSPDARRWTHQKDRNWHTEGAEPGAGVFYNPVRSSYTLVVRPDWGERRITVTETKDWRHFTRPELAVQVDAQDEPVAETYGMPCFEYEGYFVGFLWIYHAPQSRENKYWGGRMDAQLTYSLNGWHFNRTLRQPFIPNGEPGEPHYGGVYPSAMRRLEDNSLMIYASCTEFEHGHFTMRERACIAAFSLRRDGFIYLESQGGPGEICTRPLLLEGGNLSLNLSAPVHPASCALYDLQGRPIPGFGHEDCLPFVGDSTEWMPRWKEKAFEELKGRLVELEVRLDGGRLYAVRGEFTPLMHMQALRYEQSGRIPDRKGF